MLESIVYPIIAIGGLSLVFGALLGFSAKKFAVKVDPKVKQISSVLPGVNCGGCGFAGCSVFAEAVAKSGASYKGCPAGGAATAEKIAAAIGVDPVTEGRKSAFIRCAGKDENVKRNYFYNGPKNCVAAAQLATGGNKSCIYGCLGLASCKNACPFDAIRMADGLALIDSAKCTACGQCVAVCPKHLIEIVPNDSAVRVACNSHDKGRTVRENCISGCIGCTLCQKACPAGAITVTENLAHIDYSKCTLCRECVNKCPARVIKVVE